MGRTLPWWLAVGLFFSLGLTFMYTMLVGRQFEDYLLHGLAAGVAMALLLSLWSD